MNDADDSGDMQNQTELSSSPMPVNETVQVSVKYFHYSILNH